MRSLLPLEVRRVKRENNTWHVLEPFPLSHSLSPFICLMFCKEGKLFLIITITVMCIKVQKQPICDVKVEGKIFFISFLDFLDFHLRDFCVVLYEEEIFMGFLLKYIFRKDGNLMWK